MMDKERAREILAAAEALSFEDVLSRSDCREDLEAEVGRYRPGEAPLLLPGDVCDEVSRAVIGRRFGRCDETDRQHYTFLRILLANFQPVGVGAGGEELCLVRSQTVDVIRSFLEETASGAS